MRAVLLVAILLAGCVAAPAPDVGTGTDPAAVAFAPAATIPIDCGAGCFEPSVAVDPQGRIFVTDARQPIVARSTDGGATWEAFPTPPYPKPTGDETLGDNLVQIAPDGTLYYSTIVLVRSQAGAILESLQVAWSTDGAKTWAGNTILSPVDALGAPVITPDRQWLGFAEDGTIYITYNQVPTGIWSARSDDGGATWTAWTRAAPLEGRVGAGQSGPPVVDAQGRVFVPACVSEPQHTVVFVSEDKGSTFARRDLPGTTCSWFPILALDEGGGLVAAWMGNDAVLQVTRSGDAAATWSEPVAWADDGVASPWPIPLADGKLAVAWLTNGEPSVLCLGIGDPTTGPERTLDVAGDAPGGGGTHFAHGTRAPDGRLALTWTDGDVVLVAIERATA